MAQPQPHVPQMHTRPFSPAQQAQSPVSQHPGLTLPPNNHPRPALTPSPAQPGSPYQAPQYSYQQQQFAASPAPSPLNSATASPSYANANMSLPAQNVQPQSNTQYQPQIQYQNGATTPSIALPDARQNPTPAPSTPLAPGTPSQYIQATLAPMPTPTTPVPATPGVMGPPSKPAERPTKEYEYEATDSLAGTGINIRDEEQALQDYYAGSFGQDSKYGFPANPPGGKSSFYGAGFANQPAQPTDATSHAMLVAETAERAWHDSSYNLGRMRANEIENPFLLISILHRKAAEACKKHDLVLNLDLKNPNQTMGKFRTPEALPIPVVNVSTKTSPDGALVHTTGSIIPHDAYLVDQLALLSIATKHRIREKLEEGFHVATTRQKTAHGAVPADWADVAAPISASGIVVAVQGSSAGPGVDSAVSPRTTPLKRSLDSTKALTVSTKDSISFAIRKIGDFDRDAEDARLRKRQKRVNPESAASVSRAGSVAPGTPGSVAPEPDKVLTKKEIREQKKAAGGGKGGRGGMGDTSTATANQTLQHLMGGFGGRKKGKQYSWMMAASPGGPGTPTRLNTTDLPGTPGVTSNKPVQQARLTLDGKQRLGTWREDGDKGKQIQLRDWITVMEIDGRELKAIQDAYNRLDSADSALG